MQIFKAMTYDVSLKKAIIMIILLFSSIGYVLGQEQVKIVFPDNRVTIKDAFDAIQRQSEYLISVNNSNFDVSKTVELTSKILTVDEALTQLIAGSGKTYSKQDRYILIVADNNVNTNKKNISEDKPYMPDIAVSQTKPSTAVTPPSPVDVDSLSYVLTAKKVDLEAIFPPEPYFNSIEYKSQREITTGAPAYISNMPSIAVRTNLLYGLGTLTPNIGVEFAVAPKSTILASGSYNPWNQDGLENNNKKLNHWLASAEYRYWFCETFNGHFLGINGFYGFYNVSGHNIPGMFFLNKDAEKITDQYRYRGSVCGAGISYGYHFVLSKRWGLEFNAGVGIGVMNFDQYDCPKCGELKKKNQSEFFIAPTKLGVSFVYIIK